MTVLEDVCLEKESHWRISKEEWKTSFHILKTGIDSIRNGRRYSEIKRDGYSTPHTILPLLGKLYSSLFKVTSSITHFVPFNQNNHYVIHCRV
jgi:hypothetical protein